jgi:hypothetical protein
VKRYLSIAMMVSTQFVPSGIQPTGSRSDLVRPVGRTEQGCGAACAAANAQSQVRAQQHFCVA